MNELKIHPEVHPASDFTLIKNDKSDLKTITDSIGDVDELIFPDDELPYISQR